VKALLWSAFVLLGSLWSAVAALTVRLARWLLETATGAGAAEALGSAVQAPLPEALAPWIDPVWLAVPRELALDAVQWAQQFAPSPEALMGWVSPLVWTVWTVWALGMLPLLAATLLGHWLISRAARAPVPAEAGR